MGKKELVDILKRTSEMERQLKPMDGSYFPTLKTVYRSKDFQRWKTELKEELHKLKQKPLILEIIQILEDGFNNGYTDEKSFINLQGKLSVLSSHLDDYYDASTENEIVVQKMKKGTVVKTAFDEYKLIDQIGSGGNGRVFSATSIDGDSVAIKFVERNIAANKLKRFKNEIHFCERHKHKNIVEVLDRGYTILDNTEYIFYVMPRYSETLRDRMKKNAISPDDAVSIFCGLIEGLAYAHKEGTIHRDIKPENIMFKAGSNDPIICDFGIAHFAETEMLTVVETKKGDRMANFQYAAPEQRIRGEKASAQTDIYAAALILNEMFTNEIPQAPDHKTIASAAPDYKYLDDVFDQLYKQNSTDRLYPEGKILTEIRVRAEQYRNEKEKTKLQQVIDTIATPETFDVEVIQKKFIDGRIVFTFDREPPHEWFQIILNGNLGSYSAVVGYEPQRLKKEGKRAVSMSLYGCETENSITRIAQSVIDWVSKANAAYNAHVNEVVQQEQKQRENERKAEIARLEMENSINAALAKI